MFVIFWMLLATSSFTLMAFIIKLQSKQFSVADILFLRSASSIVFVLLIWIFFHFQLRTTVFRIHARRSLFGFFSMATWYYTLGVLPMGISVTLNYLSPLFLGLILFLFDRTSGRPSFKELAFVVLGFIGVVVLMNPFATTLNGNNIFPIVLGTLAAIVSALAFKDVRVLKNSGQNEWQMVFYFSAMATVLSFPFTSFARLDPSGDLTGIVALVLAGLFGALGQLGVSKAFGSGDQITAASFQYLSVVFSLLLSWAVLDETVSIVQLAGISIIVIAAIFTIAERSRRALHSVNR